MHPHRTGYELESHKVSVLDYHAAWWACVPGRSGGHFLIVVMTRAGGRTCRDCEYSRLYDPNGRLLATDLDKVGRDTMHAVLGGPGPFDFIGVYR